MPTLGESIVEGTIDHWIKQPGDEFQAYDALVEVITDKVNAEVPAPTAGKLVEILAQPGQTIAVGAPLCVVEVAGAAVAAAPASPAAPTETAAQTPAAQPAAAVEEEIPPAGDEGQHSPSVQMLASERGIDINKVAGTGIGGRVTRRDVLSYDESKQPEPVRQAPAQPLRPAAPATPAAPLPPAVLAAGDERIPLSAMRKAIADNMTRSKTTVPHAWEVVEVDMSRVSTFRNRVKDDFRKREGSSLTYVPFIIKAACEAIREVPGVNAQFDGDAIIRRQNINIGVAMGFEDALVVPVVKNTDSLSVAGIARAINDLSNKARANKLKLDDLQGGTFTINNVGTFGTIISYSIINPPQAAILTIEAVVDRVVAVDGMIAIRPMMFLCFSFDHRVIDGLVGSRFLQSVKRRLETFDPETAEVY